MYDINNNENYNNNNNDLNQDIIDATAVEETVNVNKEPAGEPIQLNKKEKKAKKGGKGKVAGMAIGLSAAMLASFGAGSLYTSYNWINKVQNNMSAATEASVVQTAAPSSNYNAVSAKSTGNVVTDVNNKVGNSVVEITTEAVTGGGYFRQYVASGAGSGVVITKDGYIATNNHVIDGAQKITVRLKDGKEYKAELVGTDPQTDVAVIKIDAKNLTPATFGSSDNVQVGETAIAIGNPLGELGGTVTSGIVSALDREIVLENQTMTLLQTNAAINPGNSGGGLFNANGELIGLVVAKSGGNNVEGIGFAIPVDIVKNVVDSLMSDGYVTGRPVLGVGVLDISTAQQAYQYGVSQLGVYVQQITEGTKAAESGLKVGDCIIAVDDTQIGSYTELTKIIRSHKVGDKVKVVVSRQNKLVNLEVELSESKPTENTEKEDTTQDKAKEQNNGALQGQDEQNSNGQSGNMSEEDLQGLMDFFNQF